MGLDADFLSIFSLFFLKVFPFNVSIKNRNRVGGVRTPPDETVRQITIFRYSNLLRYVIGDWRAK